MEKGTPHRKLTVVMGLLEVGKVRVTNSARLGAAALGDVYLKLTVIEDLLIVSFKEL